MSDAAPRLVACPHCGGQVEFGVELAGVEVDCPHCSDPFVLPDDTLPAPWPPADPAKFSAADLASAIRGRVPRAIPSLPYQAAVVAVSAAMLLLPLVYSALVSALIAAWVAMAWQCLRPFTEGIGAFGSTLWSSLPCLTGLIVGLWVIGALLWPLVARRHQRTPPLALNPAAEPLLFAFVHLICDAVGAPHPRQILVNGRLNASAAYRGGITGLFRGDLVLTIGLPLVANLTLRQFAGVLAHELGHFNQRVGLRTSSLVRAVNAWLEHVVARSATPGEALRDWASETRSWRMRLMAGLVNTGIGLSRVILRGFLLAGRLVSCWLLRQMELNADRCQIELAGAEEFERTLRHQRVLRAVGQKLYRDLRNSWDTHRQLPDNLPAAFQLATESLSATTRDRLAKHFGPDDPGPLDTHPSDEQRLAQARSAQSTGLFHAEAAAPAVFAHFEVLARQVTLLHYQEDLGLPLALVDLVPTDSFAPLVADPETPRHGESAGMG